MLDIPLSVNHLSHHSPVAVGLIKGVEFLPNLLFAVLIGVVVNRVAKHRFLGTVTVRAGLLFALFAAFLAGTPTLVVVLVAGFLLSLVSYTFHNGKNVVVKLTVDGPHLTQVNGFLSLLPQGLSIVGLALAGALLVVLPLHDGLLVMAALGMHARMPRLV